jgi:hypothetical protein
MGIETYPSGRNQTNLPGRSDGSEEKNGSGKGPRTKKAILRGKYDDRISAAIEREPTEFH